MIELQDDEGLIFFPPERIASLCPDYGGRWRAVLEDGRVAHRPTPAEGPWPRLGEVQVTPWLLQRGAEGWRDPAGFLLPSGEPGEMALAAPLPQLAELPCPRGEIWGLRGLGGYDCVWLSDGGEIVQKRFRASQAAALLPEMVKVSAGQYVNRLRLQRIWYRGVACLLTTDHGQVLRIRNQDTVAAFAARMGLSDLTYLQPCRQELYGADMLRDWPFELLRAPAEQLRAHFTTPRRLISNVIWQRFRSRSGYGGVLSTSTADSYRGLLYELAPVLHRAGFLSARVLRELGLAAEIQEDGASRAALSSAKLRILLYGIMEHLVADGRFFSFRQFGFADREPERRRVGNRLPQVILVAEKASLWDAAGLLAEELGLSLLLLDGAPSLLAMEYFAEQLPPGGTLRVLAYVDYDPGGWLTGHAVGKHLRFYGHECAATRFLIRGEDFSAEEKELYARPCSSNGPGQRTKTRLWVEESGGLDGEARGVHADHVRPLSRVRGLLLRELEAGG